MILELNLQAGKTSVIR